MNTPSSPAERLAGSEPATPEEIAAQVVAAAVWAPSVHNTQPWWFRTRGQEISLYADDGRQLRVADPAGREMMISCGAALFTARLALRSLGYIPETYVLPDPGQPSLVARVGWQWRAEPATVRPPLPHPAKQLLLVLGGIGAPLPAHPGDQRRLARIGQHARLRNVAERPQGKPGRKQRGTTADHHLPADGISHPQLPAGIGIQADLLTMGTEPPGLGVMHRRRPHRRRYHLSGNLLRGTRLWPSQPFGG